jgi:hypothetical protein
VLIAAPRVILSGYVWINTRVTKAVQKVPSCVVNSSKTLRASCLNVGLDATNSLRVLKPADILNNNNLNIGVQKEKERLRVRA